ncbi:hypothetical protein BV25DRAFT_1820484 [Artomyces pyxidatus]|uniref:Uncharacterized protein n=1 Tax=Artomyces pyxidatus TaxID=48021 RepID=A0ACB8TDL4_9AGAM|nr:hypothetical protein BV25DRAFT_1820484 [Artomyces pyxidatus]
MICIDKSFSRASDLRRHMATTAGHSNGAAASCPHCGSTFGRPDAYNRHLTGRKDRPIIGGDPSGRHEPECPVLYRARVAKSQGLHLVKPLKKRGGRST